MYNNRSLVDHKLDDSERNEMPIISEVDASRYQCLELRRMQAFSSHDIAAFVAKYNLQVGVKELTPKRLESHQNKVIRKYMPIENVKQQLRLHRTWRVADGRDERALLIAALSKQSDKTKTRIAH